MMTPQKPWATSAKEMTANLFADIRGEYKKSDVNTLVPNCYTACRQQAALLYMQ